MNKKLQAKDIPDIPILVFLTTKNNSYPDNCGATWYNINDDTGKRIPNSLYNIIDPSVPEKVVRAKMNQLIKRKLVDGCGCGCRGDYVITPLGFEYLHKHYEHLSIT